MQITSPPQPSTSEAVTAEMNTSTTSVSGRDTCSEKDRDSVWEKDRCTSRASSSVSAATLTNVRMKRKMLFIKLVLTIIIISNWSSIKKISYHAIIVD